MRWPWQKSELREVDTSYTAQMVENHMEAVSTPAKQLTGWVHAAAAAWSESLALCKVEASDPVRRALNPRVLSQLGREMIIEGGTLRRIMVGQGMIALERPLTALRLAAGRGWQVQLGEPENSTTEYLSDPETLFLPWQTNPGDPFKPVPPWKNGAGNLGNELEAALIAESSGPMGSVLFVANPGPNPGVDAQKKTMGVISPQLDFTGTKRGKLAMMMYQGTGGRGFSMDHQGKPFRVGAAPPQGLIELRGQLGAEILAACSIPPAMLAGGSPGPAMITARRNFERGAVVARCEILSVDLSEAFNEPVRVSLPAARRVDISTAARTVSALQKAGMKLDEAKSLAGL